MDKQVRMGKFLILAFLIPLGIYLKTLLPGVGWWDTGEFQTIAHTFDIAHPTGYPTYVLIGKIFLTLFNFNSVAWRMNFLSSLFVASGVFLFSLSFFKLTKNLILSLAVSLLLSVNPNLWSAAIRADPHALHFLFTAALLFLGIKIIFENNIKLLPLAFFLSGLSLGNHMLSLFSLPATALIFVYHWKSLKKYPKLILLSATGFILGLSIYLLIPIIYVGKPSLLTFNYSLATPQGLFKYVSGEDFRGLMGSWARGSMPETIKFYFDLVKKSFPYFTWLLIPAGIVVAVLKKPVFGLFCFLLFLLPLYFGLKYQNAVIERYFITSFAVEAFWIGLILSKVVKKNVLLSLMAFILPISIFFNNFKKVDESGNFQARDYAVRTFDSTEQNGVIFSWWSYTTPLWYFQKVDGAREDVTIVNANPHEWEDKSQIFPSSKPIYFIQEVSLKNKNLKLVKSGSLYKLIAP